MRDSDILPKAGARRSKSARCVALNDDKVGPAGEQRCHLRRNRVNVRARIRLPRTFKRKALVAVQTMRAQVQLVLARENQARKISVLGQRMCKRREFDGFRSGADDQPYVGRMQPSP
jgi:hypothetical protein